MNEEQYGWVPFVRSWSRYVGAVARWAIYAIITTATKHDPLRITWGAFPRGRFPGWALQSNASLHRFQGQKTHPHSAHRRIPQPPTNSGFFRNTWQQLHMDATLRPTDVVINTRPKQGQTLLLWYAFLLIAFRCLFLYLFRFVFVFVAIFFRFEFVIWIVFNFF